VNEVGLNGERAPRVEAPAVPANVWLRWLLFFSFALVLVGGLHLYLAGRLVEGFGLTETHALAVHGLLLGLFGLIFAGFVAGRRRPTLAVRATLWSAYIWMGLLGLGVTSFGLADLGRGAVGLFSGEAVAWSRELTLAAGAATLAMGLWGLAVAHLPSVTRLRVPVRGLGAGLDGLRIVQLSDLHIGQTLGRRFLRKVVAQVNALEPDVVAITGDLIEGQVHTTCEDLAPLLDLRSRYGVFFVTGNHEYYYGGRAWTEELRRLGLTVLHNEHRILERDGARLAIAGITDHEGGRFYPDHQPRPDLALDGIAQEVPRILLAHQPRMAHGVGGRRVDLQLSGHTHGGQLLPFIPFVRLQQPVISGLGQVGSVRVYTHRGTGYWGPPFRVGAAAEIAELTLFA
jgi:uncharacterized protein